MSQSHWTDPIFAVSIVFNFIAAIILVAALLPPWLDTKRSRKTYGVSKEFFTYYVTGAGLMLLNALLKILIEISDTKMIILFVIFASVNSLSLYLNSYILKVKRQNMQEAADRGISEQEYWEQYIKPTLEVENEITETSAVADPSQL